MSEQELNAILLPSGLLQLAWSDSSTKLGISTQKLQKEINNRYHQQPDKWLLYLGFCDTDIPLSPSLNFWRSVASQYTEALVQTPDLERIRHKIKIDPRMLNAPDLLEKAPFTTGAEYLSETLLISTWSQIEKKYQKEIARFEGSVEAFIHRLSPAVHLVSRVFFHLVENKKGDDPFAFLATYSTGLNQRGQSKHLPLKHALEEYQEDQEWLLELLSTVYTASDRVIVDSCV